MRMRIAVPLAVAALAQTGLQCPIVAQDLLGTVRDSATALPIRGAFLELVDSTGARVIGSLSDSVGHFRIPVVAGRYALRAEAMGYEDAQSASLDLLAGAERRVDLRLSPRPIPLPALGAEGAPRCHLRRDTAGAVLAAWNEARKTLRLADWSMKQSGLALVTRTFARTLGYRDSVGVDTVFSEPPYTPLELATARRRGVYLPRTDTVSFYAPGPDYILSDDFLETHCFSLRRSGKRIGLDFFPVAQREGDIRGTLWLDQGARAVQQIEFRFANTTTPVVVRGAGGTLDFARTADGYYIIRRWIIRVPVHRPGSGTRTRVRGGEVVKSWKAR
jgi:hypothetical protein